MQSNLASFFVGHFNPNGSALIKETTWNMLQNSPGSSFRISLKVHFLHPSLLDGFNPILVIKKKGEFWSDIKR